MEVSAHLARRGVDTTLLVDGNRLLPRLFTPEMSSFFEDYFRRNGVRVRYHARAAALEGDGRVETVRLESGEALPAAFAVAGIGVEPVTELYRNTRVHLDDDGVAVNEFLETHAPDVYAAGDITSFVDPIEGTRRRVEHWDNAAEQGRCAARNMMGHQTPFEHVAYFFSDVFDLSWEFWGDTRDSDAVVYRGDVPGGAFSAWWLKEGRLTAAFIMNRPEAERELAPKWLRERKEFSPDELHDDDAFSAIHTHH